MMRLSLLLVMLFGLGQAFANDLDFVLVNDTNRSFEAVYVSATTNKDWDGNLLPDNKVLRAGGKLTVKFPKTVNSPTWDMNVVDDEGLVVRFNDINLVNVEKITLKDVDGKITAVIE